MKELATRLIRRRRIFKYVQHCGHGNPKESNHTTYSKLKIGRPDCSRGFYWQQ